MIHLSHVGALAASAIHTQLDLRNYRPQELEKVLCAIFSRHMGQIVTVRCGEQPVLTLSIEDMSQARELGLIYVATLHRNTQGRSLVQCALPRSHHQRGEDSTYLTSRTLCTIDKRVMNFAFRLPHLGDIERNTISAQGYTQNRTLLCDTRRAMYVGRDAREIYVCAYTGIGAQKQVNEDALMVRKLYDGSHLLGVIDGVGGRGAGLLAARAIAGYISTNVSPRTSLRGLSMDLPRELYNVHTEAMLHYPELASPRMGAVLAAVKVRPASFEAVRAGDCRIAQYRSVKSKMQCVWSTQDEVTAHKKPGNLAHLKDGKAGALDMPLMHQKILEGDTLVLGTDGFWQALTMSEIATALTAHTTLEAVASQYAEVIERRMKRHKSLRDNFSYIVYHHRPSNQADVDVPTS